MQNKKLAIVVLAIAMLDPAFGYSKSYTTVFTRFAPLNCTEAEASFISGIMRKKIDRIKFCELLSEKIVTKIAMKTGTQLICRDRSCAIRIANNTHSRRVIYGFIKKDYITSYTQLEKEGAGKYLVKKQVHNVYRVIINLIDVEKNTILCSLSDTIHTQTTSMDADRIIAKLQKYFTFTNEDELKNKAVKKEGAKKIAAHNKSGRSNTTNAGMQLTYQLLASVTGFYPLGSFSALAKGSVGITLSASIDNMGTDNLLMRLQAGYYFVFPKERRVKSYHMIPLSLIFGYSLSLPMGFSITPLIGGGYVVHLLSEDANKFRIYGYYRFSNNRYYDPHVLANLEMAYHITDFAVVSLKPGFLSFFERSATGMIIQCDIGFNYSF